MGKKVGNCPTLVRARYAAYVLHVFDYIVDTTHPASPQYRDNKEKWKEEIEEFCKLTTFHKLEILEAKEEKREAFVTFFIKLFHQEKEVSFTEKSLFEKTKEGWLYKNSKLISGRAPNFMTESCTEVLPLAYYGDPILRKKAEPVVLFDKELKKLVKQMIDTMEFYNGMGLAAPQVHHSIQLFIVKAPKEDESFEKVKVFINPEILSYGKKSWKTLEGCLSIPTVQGKVSRPEEVVVQYCDLEGNLKKESLSGWEARVMLHEYDHIQGILFLDHLSKVERKELEPFLERLQNRIHNGKEL